MPNMRAAQVSRPGGPLELVERPVPDPGSGSVRIHSAKMGFRTVAIARGEDKEPLARQLGALHYIDSQSNDPAAELTKLGCAKVVVATVTHGPAMSATLGGLGPRGRLMVLERAPEAYDRMMSGKARFRVVLTMES